jgi:hypothetical protein
MFKISSCEQELIEGMEKQLLKSEEELPVAQAADLICAAAAVIDKAGFTKEAEILTAVLQSLAGDKPSLEDWAEKGINFQTLKDMGSGSPVDPVLKNKAINVLFDNGFGGKDICNMLSVSLDEIKSAIASS